MLISVPGSETAGRCLDKASGFKIATIALF
jgi:hypothetical protein